MRLIGVLGGTFNPVHYGHLRMAQTLLDNLALEEVRFIPSATPPHKPPPAVSASMRAEMVRLAINDNPRFSLDSCELERAGASYTIDTLDHLKTQLYKNTAICLIMGADAFHGFNTWHRWQTILNKCHIILVQRQQDHSPKALAPPLATLLQTHYSEQLADLQQSAAGCILMHPIATQEISATQIRALVQQRQSAKYLLPDTVLDYIDQHQLYR